MTAAPSLQTAPALAALSSRTRSRDLYRIVWRWHFYAGLLIAPFLLISAATGVLLVYAPELRVMSYPDRYLSSGSTSAAALTLDEQYLIARAAQPEAKIETILVDGPERTTLFTMKRGDGPPRMLAVDPYEKSRTVSFKAKDDWLGDIENFHRRLFMGTTGRIITELVTGWAMIMAITGIFLWWPRGKFWRESALKIRFRQGAYLALRDSHAVIGALVALLVIAQAFSGLTMSLVEGGLIKSYLLRVPPRTAPAERRGGVDVNNHESHDNGPALSWEAARLIAVKTGFTDVPLSLRRAARGAVVVTERPRFGAAAPRSVEIDAAGQIVRRFTDPRTAPLFSRVAKSVHLGTIGGGWSLMLSLVVAVILAGLCVTGCIMWWIRRPPGRWGMPARVKDARLSWGVLTAILLVALLVPVAGASMLVAWAADRLWQRFTLRAAQSSGAAE
ncbi:MAG: PepSY domain-containing protein [Phycisphaeraceae bacterium]|nr:PepSY domain-containing protein [Phycisphaeraceae bacterium]